MTYAEKLRNPKWQKKRLEIMQRDNFTCRMCDDKKSTLHVHHRIYFNNRDPWEYDNLDLYTLCENCHDLIHQVEKIHMDMCELHEAVVFMIKMELESYESWNKINEEAKELSHV